MVGVCEYSLTLRCLHFPLLPQQDVPESPGRSSLNLLLGGVLMRSGRRRAAGPPAISVPQPPSTMPHGAALGHRWLLSASVCPPASGTLPLWLCGRPDLTAAMSYLPVPTLRRQESSPFAVEWAGPPRSRAVDTNQGSGVDMII